MAMPTHIVAVGGIVESEQRHVLLHPDAQITREEATAIISKMLDAKRS